MTQKRLTQEPFLFVKEKNGRSDLPFVMNVISL